MIIRWIWMTQHLLDSPTNLPDSEPLPWFSVDYRRLYDVLCQTVHTDQSTLLLYMLLHRNQHFKAYVISRTNIDQIVCVRHLS